MYHWTEILKNPVCVLDVFVPTTQEIQGSVIRS